MTKDYWERKWKNEDEKIIKDQNDFIIFDKTIRIYGDTFLHKIFEMMAGFNDR